VANHTLFISDLHLEPAHPGITHLFLSFLQNQAAHADALYILGDLFAAWLGDDDSSEFNQEMMTALRALTAKGVPVYFMHGNRDFLIGKKFLQQSGCRLLTDPTVIDLYGTPVLLMHGDTLCTEDKMYLRYRYFARNIFLQKIFLSLPLSYRKKIANYLRSEPQSQNVGATGGRPLENTNEYGRAPLAPTNMDAVQSEIDRVMQQHNVQLLIHGHTHRPAIYTNRIVLSDWHDDKGNVLVCAPDGARHLEYF
jgi:UDP-2,3-diacylglucosamine hydrolase